MLSSAALLGSLVVALWLACNGLIVFVYRRQLWALWREPVFRCPVLIVESDDWGAGPLSQAPALRDIAQLLARHRDAAGRAPVMSLALVLAVPDGPAIRRTGVYRRVCLDDPRFVAILDAVIEGRSRGVFALQLHGLEHYWPEALAGCKDPDVRAWLEQNDPARTESLPSHLQSRWVDASVLPSRQHAARAIDNAVAQEVDAYTRILGETPKVVVPPTFVWTCETESAWAAHGVECVVTPGWRYVMRNARGLPDGDEGPIVNGDRSGGVGYLARSDYFEPARGRDAEHALAALERMVTQGRPCLLENHRDNFIGGPFPYRQAMDELDKLYRTALARHRDLRFLSSWDLHCVLRDLDPEWLVKGWRARVPALWQRLRHAGRPWRLARLTGAAFVADLVGRLLGNRTSCNAPFAT